ncbi:TonB-dependent receptor [Sulfurovum sp. zt1-1]|uniref:TonB-dependent receptor n=1 Tax=Sulfurovum zhangzhouensis TaxID=3019067 RepID=A0ABT7QXA2_9BACT|nr:TonB-dependent receptor plug domain-containing protein [Sulfurovum zhangzhouensis]MDM5270966.1 TonB-dependent receptor [Sulfurovum zhangzhouensis]
MNNTIKLSIAVSLLLTITTHAAELEPITVTTTNKTEHSINDTTSNVTVITAEELDKNGYQNVAQAINSIAGISVANSGGLGQQTSFFVRGADSGKVLVLLDGMRLNDPSTTNGTALLESLTTDNIQQIEIIKGGMSSIWGTNASAGVINIITKTPQEGTHGSLSLLYGSYKTKGIDADIGYKDDKFSAQLLASYLDTEGISALAPRDAEKDAYTNKNINLKLGYRFDENNKIQLSYNRIKTETEYDDSWSTAQAEDDYSHAQSDQENTALQYDYKSGDYRTNMYASQGKYERTFYTNSYGVGVNVYEAKLKEFGMINSYDYSRGKAVLGLEYKDIDGFNQYNDYPASQADYTNKAVYLSNLYRITTGTLIETNIRYDNFEQFENKVTYKAGIKHEYNKISGLGVGANYYTSYDAPSSYQLANVVFGSELKPAFTKGYELSAHYKELLTITYFNNKVKDSIDYDMVNYGYYNIDGVSKFKGLEVESIYPFETMNLNISANYTHLFEAKKEDGSDLFRRPKDTVNLSANYYTDSSSYGITAQYVGDRTDLGDMSTGNYTLWNLNYARELTDEIKLTLNAKNIFDKEYQSVYGYATEGRSVYTKIRYRF